MAILAASIVAIGAFWNPSLRIVVRHSELANDIERFNPVRATGGWFGLRFRISHTPLLSLAFLSRMAPIPGRD